MRTFIRVIIGILTVATGFLLLLTDIMSYVRPSTTLYTLCPLTLFFSTFVVIIFFLAVYWFIRKRWIIGSFCIIMLAVSTPNMLRTYCSVPDYETVHNPDGIRFLSYNVHLFSWFENEKGIDNANKMLDYIAATGSDVVCLQEFLYHNSGTYTLSYIKEKLKSYPYSHIEVLSHNRRVSKCIATFSKYPIVEQKAVKFDVPYHGAIISAINIKGTVYNVVNCYLKSNQLTEQEKDLTPDYIGTKPADKSAQGLISRVYNKLVKASLERCNEAETVAREIEKINRNMIVCGDMNDIPASYVYRTMRGHMKDAMLLTHSFPNAGVTFHEGIYNFRIDYFFISDNIKPCEFSIDKQPMSDHYPIQLTVNR
ncbi:MAG: endonuclease/exonuclease/phosphatase family protein [Paludibacteraceae bacterium]|nr:endonuclease/exonuclease/phosphatase family protein [Paludibacteraceae bacterium]